MKTAIFNFLVLQVVIWAFVFKSGENHSGEINFASVTDTWEVAKVDEAESVFHYPSFNKLTLNSDGSYIRLKDDETVETGSWEINKIRTELTLMSSGDINKYEIVQLPNSDTKSFIIKEYIDNTSITSNIKYELTRI